MNITKINVLFLLIRLKGFAPQTPKDLSHYSQNFIFIGKIRRSYSLLLKFWHLKRRSSCVPALLYPPLKFYNYNIYFDITAWNYEENIQILKLASEKEISTKTFSRRLYV